MFNNKSVVVIIPARKGSVGLPGKNWKLLHGKPVIEYSIEHAISSKYVDKILVTSDSKEIEKITLEYISKNPEDKRIVFIKRPDVYCGPNVSSETVMIHALSLTNKMFGAIVLLQPTSPVRQIGMLDKCIEKFFNENADSLSTSEKHTPFFVQKNIKGGLDFHFSKTYRTRRQELKAEEWYYHDDGNISIVKHDVLQSWHTRIGSKHIIYENEAICSLQIDTEMDFKMIEALMPLMEKQK